MNEIRDKAKEIFEATTNSETGAFALSTNYWQIGNVFDTLTDYLAVMLSEPGSGVSKQSAQEFVGGVLDRYNSMNQTWNQTGNMYDDFGWWGIAGVKAYDPAYADVFGEYAMEFQNIAMVTWDTMHNGKYDSVHWGAPNAWAHCDQDYFAAIEPRFDGGLWQYDIYKDPRQGKDEKQPYILWEQHDGGNPSNPLAGAVLGPFQMTVVNGLYFVLSLRLAAVNRLKAEPYSNLFKFISKWIEAPTGKPGDDSLLLQPGEDDSESRLFRERVSTYKNLKSAYVDTFPPDTCWAGDQGLFLGGLTDFLVTANPDPTDASNAKLWIEWLVQGMAGYMKNEENAAEPWYPTGTTNGLNKYDAGDYLSGTGTYMRYLAYAYDKNNDVKTTLDDLESPARTMLESSVSAVLKGTLPHYGDSEIFKDFNELAVLVTALKVGVDSA